MTAIFLIFFSILFYQFLIKPALNPSTTPNNANRNFSKTAQNENLMRMWRNLRQYKGEQSEGEEEFKIKKAQKEAASNNQPEGFRGGEYIEYEDL
jgi:hypothetical protein